MDNKAVNKVQPVMRKAKKKQVKDELDRIKQAEKKKRRLEKALATSAAIRSELEKKKQQKKEEQQRLDEEGAAIAEAVALHVLGEDSDDSCKIVLKKEEDFSNWECAQNIDLFMGGRRAYLPHRAHTNFSRWVSNTCPPGSKWADLGNNDWSFTYGPYGRDLHAPYSEDVGWDSAGHSAEMFAVQAVSALQITDDAEVDAMILNGMLRG